MHAFSLLLLFAALFASVHSNPYRSYPVTRNYRNAWNRPGFIYPYRPTRPTLTSRPRQVGIGKSCAGKNRTCRSHLTCRGRAPDRICKRILNPGQVCGKHPNNICGAGYRCLQRNRRLRCLQKIPLRAFCGKPHTTCGINRQCTWMRIYNGSWAQICVRRVKRRGTCSIKELAMCAPGLKCNAARKLCMRPAPSPFTDFLSFNRRRFVNDRITVDLLCPRKDVRTYSGYCNNRRNPMWGSANSTFFSKAAPVNFNFSDLPNARVVSNTLCAEAGQPTPNSRGMSELVTGFGQFIDHTITFTDNSKDSLNIPIPPADTFLPGAIPFFRTQKRDGIPVNFMSSYIDGVNVYGRSDDVAMEIREHEGGRLRLPGNLLPREGTGNASAFVAGDTRANENPLLTSLHTIFAREHNRVCAEILLSFPNMSDEDVYELARSIVVAQMQAVVYYEWLPAVLGRLVRPYRGYRANVQGAISNEFSTVAFRVGHTLVNSAITVVATLGTVTKHDLRTAFFNPDFFTEHGPDAFLRGAMRTRAAEVDSKISDDLRVGLVGERRLNLQLDLAALNIQRARDNGVPLYNDLRVAYGLPRVTAFADISTDAVTLAGLAKIYSSVDQVDAWIGGLCEDRSVGSLGPLFAAIWESEFMRLRDGDRFYFEKRNAFKGYHVKNILTLRELVGNRFAIGNVMRNLIERNTDIEKTALPKNPFLIPLAQW